MAKKNRSTRRNRKNRKTMKGGDNMPAANTAATNTAPTNTAATNTAATPPANTGKLMGGKRRSRKLSPGAQAWRQHVMKTFKDLRAKDRNATFSQALKTAGKTYRK